MNRKDDRRAVAARHRSFHGGVSGQAMKKNVQPSPAWNERNLPQGLPGSKILLSNLPNDVGEEEVLDLMKKTVGPIDLRYSFMSHNSKGVPMGVAVIAFVKSGDAAKARKNYHGKVIDGKRAIKLELIYDKDEFQLTQVTTPQSAAKQVKSLAQRLGTQIPNPPIAKTIPLPPRPAPSAGPNNKNGDAALARQPRPAVKRRVKKGPKRVKKSAADLDQEMEEYNAQRLQGNAF